MFFVLVLLTVVAIVIWWWNARRARIARFTKAAIAAPEEFLGDAELFSWVDDGVTRGIYSAGAHGSGSAVAQGAFIAGVVAPTQVLYHLAQMDPSVIQGIATSGASIVSGPNDYLGMISFAAENAAKFDSVGFTSRLQGYVGEVRAQEILTEQGYGVVLASTSNNPGFDLQVNGDFHGHESIDVKVVGDLSTANVSALDRPDVAHFVNGDASGSTDLPNVFIEPSLSREGIQDSLQSTLESSKALSTGDLSGYALEPFSAAFALGLIAHSQYRAVKRGEKLVEAAVVDGVWIAVGQIPGTLAGVQLGAIAGAKIGASVDALTLGGSGGSATLVGSVGGAVIGGATGSAVGNKTVSFFRDKPIRQNGHKLDASLTAYGAACTAAGVFDELESLIAGPLNRAIATQKVIDSKARSIRNSWQWRAWPTAPQVLIIESAQVAVIEVKEAREVFESVQADLSNVRNSSQPDIALGLLLAKNSILRTMTKSELPELDEVRLLYLRQLRLLETRKHPLTTSRLRRRLKGKFSYMEMNLSENKES